MSVPDCTHTRLSAAAHYHEIKGNSMGDRGGKKDKEKNQQQLAKKQKQKDQRKQDKTPPRTTLAVNT